VFREEVQVARNPAEAARLVAVARQEVVEVHHQVQAVVRHHPAVAEIREQADNK
jgi:predicted dehydrogenase